MEFGSGSHQDHLILSSAFHPIRRISSYQKHRISSNAFNSTKNISSHQAHLIPPSPTKKISSHPAHSIPPRTSHPIEHIPSHQEHLIPPRTSQHLISLSASHFIGVFFPKVVVSYRCAFHFIAVLYNTSHPTANLGTTQIKSSRRTMWEDLLIFFEGTL